MLTPTRNWRYERKFLVQDLTEAKLNQVIKLNRAGFTDIYAPRFVNNIYFDTQDLGFYEDNVGGKAERLKVRIRWYGDLFGSILDPVLEIKIKQGGLGIKESYRLNPTELTQGDRAKTLQHYLKDSVIPKVRTSQVRDLLPTLINRYHRQYFLSLDSRYRLTLDTALIYLDPIAKSLPTFRDDYSKILELKYSQDADKDADTITKTFSFEVTKNSKYVSGIQQTVRR